MCKPLFDATVTPKKNILAICASSNCGSAFDATMLEYLQAVDTSFDGVAYGTQGQVVAVNANVSGNSTTWIVTASNVNPVDWTSQPTALLYYFDSKR